MALAPSRPTTLACGYHASLIVMSPGPHPRLDLPLHAEAYANADFSEPNSKFVTLAFVPDAGAGDGAPPTLIGPVTKTAVSR
jgi:hypothetical protein